MKAFILKTANRIKEALRYFLEADMFVYAGNAALFIGMAVFPLIILLLSLLRLFPSLGPEQLKSFLVELLPAVPEISETVSALAAELELGSSSAVSWISGLTALFSASTGVFAVMKGLARLYHVRKQSWIRYRLIALAYTVALLVLIVLTLGTELAAKLTLQIINSQMDIPALKEASNAVATILKYFQAVITAAAFLIAWGLYGFPFDKGKKLKRQVPGAVFAAAGWFLATKLFTLSIGWFWKPSVVYGSLTAIVIIALWGYVIISILFMGAALNRALSQK